MWMVNGMYSSMMRVSAMAMPARKRLTSWQKWKRQEMWASFILKCANVFQLRNYSWANNCLNFEALAYISLLKLAFPFLWQGSACLGGWRRGCWRRWRGRRGCRQPSPSASGLCGRNPIVIIGLPDVIKLSNYLMLSNYQISQLSDRNWYQMFSHYPQI